VVSRALKLADAISAVIIVMVTQLSQQLCGVSPGEPDASECRLAPD
jgi:hypothetical protein